MTCNLLNVDAFALLGGLADDSVDHVLTDLPYDEKTHAGQRSIGATESMIDFRPVNDEQIAIFVSEALRVAKRWVITFCALEQFGAYQNAAGESWIRSGVWIRWSGPQYSGDRPAQQAEGVAIMHRPGRKTWNGGGHGALWNFPSERHDRVGPCQKPLPLMLRMIEQFTDEDDLILDPFSGVGSTAVACIRSKRRFLGCELVPATHAVALERIAAERQGLTLEAARSGQTSLLEGLR